MGVTHADKCQCHGSESQDGGIPDGAFHPLQEDGEEAEFLSVGFTHPSEHTALLVLEHGRQFRRYQRGRYQEDDSRE